MEVQKSPVVGNAAEAMKDRYPIDRLKEPSLPSNVDLGKLEDFVLDEEFKELFMMERGAFESAPNWKKRLTRKQACTKLGH